MFIAPLPYDVWNSTALTFVSVIASKRRRMAWSELFERSSIRDLSQLGGKAAQNNMRSLAFKLAWAKYIWAVWLKPSPLPARVVS